MKCRNCKCNGFLTDDDGKQFSWCHRFGDNLDINEERYCPDYTPATNADKIRAMTDDELAKRLAEIADCVACEMMFDMKCRCHHEFFSCWQAWLDWLKKEATND